MWWKKKKVVAHNVHEGEYKAAIKRIKSNPMFINAINTVIDFELGTLDQIWWGEKDNDTLRAYQGQGYALRNLKILFSHNPKTDVKEE